jgi:hypothetical protein
VQRETPVFRKDPLARVCEAGPSRLLAIPRLGGLDHGVDIQASHEFFRADE